MRVLHISTGATGGAFLAAKRIVKLQSQMGLEAHFLTQKGLYSNSNELSIFYEFIQSRKILAKVNTVLMSIMTNRKSSLLTSSSKSILNRSIFNKFEYDVVHIHNWFNLLSHDDLEFITQNFPTVFTLHDLRLITGGCHYPKSCKGYNSQCKSCPDTYFFNHLPEISHKRLHSILQSAKNVAITAPSNWLLNIARSNLSQLSIDKFKFIQNPVDLNPALKIERPDSDKKIWIIFAAAKINASEKGLDLLVKALNQIIQEDSSLKGKLGLKVVGEGHQSEGVDFEIKYTGYLSGEELSNEIKSSHLFVVPSRSENAPSVVLEAQALSVLVAASNVGGIPELIDDGKTGLLFSPNVNSIKEMIIRYLNLAPVERELILSNARNWVTEYTHGETIQSMWLNLYRELNERK